MTESKLLEILQEGVTDGVAPGMSAAVGNADETWFADTGRHTFAKDSPVIGEKTLWDLASLTKIVATTSIAMSLVQSNELDLDAHVQSVVAEFVGDDKDEVTVRNLLMHDSGLAAYGNYESRTNALEVKDVILRSALRSAPGKKCEYSCLGFVALMEVEQRLTGLGFEELLQKRLTGPLGLKDTFFKPSFEDRKRTAPTEKYIAWRKKLEDLRGFKRVSTEFIQGAVHDPIAYLIGGVSGNAGLFSTSRDLAKVARAWMLGADPFKKETIAQFTKKQNDDSTYGLGFDTRSEEDSSAGTKFSIKSFGHTGYTGTTIWVDPANQLFAVLLTNRVHPSAANMKIKKFRPKFHDDVFELIAGA
jgi:CubicO group peptidase (beta-lactamase class C family)